MLEVASELGNGSDVLFATDPCPDYRIVDEFINHFQEIYRREPAFKQHVHVQRIIRF